MPTANFLCSCPGTISKYANDGHPALSSVLALDLRNAFPGMRGFSPRNLKYMRSFAEAWPDVELVQQAAARLPRFHLCTLIDKLNFPNGDCPTEPPCGQIRTRGRASPAQRVWREVEGVYTKLFKVIANK